MEPSSDSSPDSCANPLTDYLLTLRRCKDTLPYGQLICISASPSITTMAALLRLAKSVGPFIAVLQVHADIIDDWSPEGASRLVEISRAHGFLIWEGGRILNTHKHAGDQVLSPKEIQRDIDLARKRYTKGIVNVASWAGLASTWTLGQEEQQNGGDRLVPTLRRAARETVTLTANAVRTEISAGQGSENANNDTAEDHVEDKEDDDWGLEDDDADLARKTSVISLTHTITQHTGYLSQQPTKEITTMKACSVQQPTSTKTRVWRCIFQKGTIHNPQPMVVA
ncbi:hypothetical protein KEM56_005025 [Ascosphaera pollenicola]|nr:hypothetical protein KEM56_005025 [Ascosphaera pollenicola]